MALFDTRREPTEMDRVMENLRQAEGELQQKIYQLGQMYYEDNKNTIDTESKYYALVDLITKIDENRKGFFRNKLRLEGQMLCENCNAVIPYGSMFCNHCGKKASEKEEGAAPAAPVASNRCANCGEELEAGSMFCGACGTKVQ